MQLSFHWSCRLIVNRKLTDDRRHVRDFMDADFCRSGGTSTLFLEWTPSRNANIFSRFYAHSGKTLNISTANDSTFTVCNQYTIMQSTDASCPSDSY